MEAELKFIRSQPKGNRGRDKGRLKKYDDLVEAAAASRDAERVQSGAIAIAPGPRLGGFVVRAERLTRRVGEADAARTLFSDLSFELPKVTLTLTLTLTLTPNPNPNPNPQP